MKKFIIIAICIIIIIAICIISSMSLYGKLNSEREKVADMKEIINYENAQEVGKVQEEQTGDNNFEQKAEESLEEQKEITYQAEESKNKDINTKKETAVKSISNEKTEQKEVKKETHEITNTVKEQEVKSQDTQEKKQENIKTEQIHQSENKQCSNGKHMIERGNSKRWFKTEQEAINLYNKLQKEWSDKLISGATSDEEYDRNCPYGYETWDCPNCKQWTINFYYR